LVPFISVPTIEIRVFWIEMLVIESSDLIPSWGIIPTNDVIVLWFLVFCLIVFFPFLIPRRPMSSGFYLEGEKGRSDLFLESPF
jgi:hypothetical protein